MTVQSFLKRSVKDCKGAFLTYFQLMCWHLSVESGDNHCHDQHLNWVNPEFVSSVISSTKLVVCYATKKMNV